MLWLSNDVPATTVTCRANTCHQDNHSNQLTQPFINLTKEREREREKERHFLNGRNHIVHNMHGLELVAYFALNL